MKMVRTLIGLLAVLTAGFAFADYNMEEVKRNAEVQKTQKTLVGGTIYNVTGDVTYDLSGTAGASAWAVSKGATCIINIRSGATLTLIGGNASGATPAGCGLEVPADATVFITGEGKLVATGGKAGDGSNGSLHPLDSLPNLWNGGKVVYGTPGLGGAGGAGGGGAAPGIGGKGGAGGAGGAAFTNRKEHNTTRGDRWQVEARTGNAGGKGGAGGSMGNVYVLGLVMVSAQAGGAAAAGGSCGPVQYTNVSQLHKTGNDSYWEIRHSETVGYIVARYWGGVEVPEASGDLYVQTIRCWQGGAGAGGGGGKAASFGIGGGAGGGGGGGAGGEGGCCHVNDNWFRGYGGKAGQGVPNGGERDANKDTTVVDASGGAGGAGGGMGDQGGNGRLFVTAWANQYLATAPIRTGAQAQKTAVDHSVRITFSHETGMESRTGQFMSAMPEPPVVSKPGYRFLGWYLRGLGYKVYDELNQPIVDLCQFVDEMDLEAKWEAGPLLGVVNVTEDGTNLGPDAMGNLRVTLRDAVLAFSTNATLTGVDGLRRIMFELPEGQDTIRLQREIEIPEGAEPFEIFGLDNRTGKAVTISPDPNFGNHRFFTVSSSVSFRFLNFVGGRSSENGGAIYMLPEEQSERSKCSLVLADCSFRNNSSTGASGGAVWARWMSCSIYNCTFEGNQAKGWGGAVSVSPYHEACFVNCTFSGNRADYGGGLDVNDTRDKAPTYLVGCTFAGNSASPNHGMSISDYSKLTVLGSLFADGAEDASLLRSGSKAACTLICSSFGEPAAFFAGGATPVTNDILGVVQVAYPPLPSNAELRDAVEIYYDGLLENVAYQKPGEEVKTALCGDATKAQVRLGFDQLRAIRLCPTRGAIRLASGGDDAFVNVEGRLAVPNARNAWELNKSYTARVTVNYDDATTNVVMVPLKTSDSGYFATSVAVDGSDGYSHNVTSLTFQADAEDAASLTVPNVAVTTVPYALVAASAELVDFPEAGQVRGLETSVNSFVSEQGVVAEKMTVGGDFTAATVQGGGNLKLEGVSLRGGELAWFADGAGKTCGNLDTLDAMPFAEGGQESANGTRTWTAEADGFVQVLFVNGTGETKVSLKVGEVWITPPDGHAVKNASASESRRMLWTVPVSKGQAVEFKANGGWRNCQFIPFGK